MSKINAVIAKMPFFGVVAMEQVTELKRESVRQQLSRWEKRGEVVRIKRGVYTTREFYLTHKESEMFPVWVSSVIEPHSYVSREWVLAKYGVLTEATYPVTAVTEKNTKKLVNKMGSYHYYHIRSELFDGYNESSLWGVIAREASLPKALFDYLYGRRVQVINLVEEERLNINDWNQELRSEFAIFCERSQSQKMKRILSEIKRSVWL